MNKANKPNMNKAKIIEAITEKTGLSKSKVDDVIAALIDTITKALKKGEKVTLVNFGSFSTAARQARTGRNPKSGKEIKIPATVTPKFKPGKGLKDAVIPHSKKK